MMSLQKGLMTYLLVEIIILGVHYILLVNSIDFIFELLETSIVLGVITGIYFAGAAIVFRINKKITKQSFFGYLLLSCLGILLPFVLLFSILSRLH